MKAKTRFGFACVAALVAASAGLRSAHAAPLGSGFTYQGQLQQSGIPSTGACDFQFSVWNALTDGTQLGSTQTVGAVSVTDGLFTVALNGGGEFGASAFAGEDRWLQIGVRCPTGGGSYSTLSPRQPLTAAPYALYAPAAGSAADVSCSGCVGASDIANGAVTSSKIAGGTIQQSNLAFTPGTVTSINAGTGLTGGTITTSGTIAANFGTASGTVAAGNHDHLGQSWAGFPASGNGLWVTNFSSDPGSTGVIGSQGFLADTTGLGSAAGGPILIPPAGVSGFSVNGNGVFGQTYNSGNAGVFGTSETGEGVRGASLNLTGVYGATLGGEDGVYGRSDRGGILSRGALLLGGHGVHGDGTASNLSSGVFGEARAGWGVQGTASSGTGVGGYSTFGNGVLASSGGATRDNAALRSNNTNTVNGMAAYLTNNSSFATAHLANAGAGQVAWLQNGGTDANGSSGGDFITCVNDFDTQFRVLTSGEARSDVGFNTPAADFAEMLPAVAGLEPGDVLSVAPDGQLTRSSAAHETNVIGVYSTNPGFVGGKPMDGEAPGTVPLAVVGVVPVKASAENGPIHPGDLLAASATPGHAMIAGPHPVVGTVIGKALGELARGTGVIRMVVTLQ